MVGVDRSFPVSFFTTPADLPSFEPSSFLFLSALRSDSFGMWRAWFVHRVQLFHVHIDRERELKKQQSAVILFSKEKKKETGPGACVCMCVCMCVVSRAMAEWEGFHSSVWKANSWSWWWWEGRGERRRYRNSWPVLSLCSSSQALGELTKN